MDASPLAARCPVMTGRRLTACRAHRYRFQANHRARLIVTDFFGQAPQALSDLEGWVRSGRMKVLEDIVHGFENLPAALIGLLAGDNVGKRMVKVA